MTPEVAVDLFREALWLTTTMVAILVVPSLIVGLIVSMFQAALVTLIVVGPWMVRTFMEYITNLYTSIPQVIG
jgi:flagellar biosynthetic protein FliQ